MNYKETTIETFTIVGISVRTSNENGKSQKDIGELWNRFFTEQIAVSIPNKISEDIYCVYTDYESDFRGDYTTIIGCKVSSAENLREGLIVKHIPDCTYCEYVSVGKIPDCVGNTWMHIWDEGERINRSYIADYDVYGTDASDPEDATINTCLSVK